MILSEKINHEILQKHVPNRSFTNNYDIIVVGLGTAGAIAAIAAARKGLKVLGIERNNCMGGTGTAGAILNYYLGAKGGLFESIDKIVGDLQEKDYTPSHGVNGELKKYILEQEAVKAGIEVCYESTVIGVFLERNTVKGIRFISPDGVKEAGTKIIIDCTGEAEVCSLANCETRKGRSLDKQGQPFTNVLVMLRNGKVVNSNTDAGYVDQTDGYELSQAIIGSATSPLHLRDKYEEDEKLLYIASQLGIREGRFILGEENITFKDYDKDIVIKQPVFYSYSRIDNHSKDLALESELQQDWSIVASLWGLNFSLPVPLGALIPKGYDGIMVAGRCLAAEHDISSAVRMKRDMQKCGEAAATAAYLSVKYQIPIKDIPYEELASLLRKTHCLDEKNNVGLKIMVSMDDSLNQPIRWITDPAEIKNGLNSERPGVAIWSARRLGENIIENLRQWMNGESEHLKKHSAFALGLLGAQEALSVLRNMVMERDSFTPKTSKSYNQARGYVSIYLIGKLKDIESVPLLIDIINDSMDFKYRDFIPSEFLVNREELYFQYFSHALIALLKIGRHHGPMRNIISTAIEKALIRENLELFITLKAAPYCKYSMKNKMIEIVKSELQNWGCSGLLSTVEGCGDNV